ncbi:MAG: trimeric autotransporter adhesin [Pseudonocardiales bacterium]|jgi:PKD repeat protein|nr:trimeric autotransporter adhesin [Pseudonocardiales bacterium]
MHGRRLAALTAALLFAAPALVVQLVLPAASATMATAGAGTTTVPRPDHIVVVVEENHSQTNILGNSDAPFISSLAAQNASFTQSFAVTHPSQPNYLAMFSGSTQGVTDDACPYSFSTPNLASQLLQANLGFAGYSEDQPSAGYTGCGTAKYVRKHNPWVDFPAVPASSNLPFTSFPADYSTLPEVSFVVPNLNNDMHDGTVAQGDSWLQANFGGYIEWAKTHNSLFVLTFDEDDNQANNRIPTVLAGQRVTPGSYPQVINHYSLLRTIQDAYGLSPLGASATAAPILDVWTPPAGDQPPTAAFTSSCSGLTCTFDASGSSDPDGAVASYSWSFGDGGTASGARVSHGYPSGGSYQVELQVADDAGATASRSTSITLTAPGGTPFASDRFARTVSNGFGAADVGGAWAVAGNPASYSVGGGAAAMRMASPASQVTATLPPTSSDTDLSFNLSSDKLSTGNGVYLTVTGRKLAANNEYRARLRITSANTVRMYLSRLVGGAETAMTSDQDVAGISYSAGMALTIRLQVTGTSPTVVRSKLWPAGGSEPAGWQASAVDSTTALQAAGSIAITSYLASSATNAPVTVRISSLTAKPTAGTPPPANKPPIAAFSSSCTDLSCSFNGSSSSDPDGTIASYAWDFGDGSTGTGAQPAHTYAAAGSFSVTLTVTDNSAATGAVSHSVTATMPALIASDRFARTVSNGFGTADVGGPWSVTGNPANFSVAAGTASMRLATAGTQLTATLAAVSSSDTDLTVNVTADKALSSSGVYLTFTGRRVSASNEYRARARLTSTNTVQLYVSRLVAGTETALSTDRVVTGLAFTPGANLTLRLQVSGTGTTTVRAKIWAAGTAEPASWFATATDTTAVLQGPGSLALTAYLSSGSTSAPVVIGFGNLSAKPAA